ncbi:MAG: hypothetical protein KDC54_17150 [Lewinella sp.]|nr:hypothetical protein [Lewinella sp.]
MRLVLNIVLLLIAAALAFVLYKGIEEPIAFNKVRKIRRDAVVAKLELIRDAQEMYRDIKGIFADDFDSLAHVLKTDSFMIVAVIGDPDDPNFTGEIEYDTTYKSALDSIRALGMNVDSLRYVPHGHGEVFDIAADTIEYQSTLVPVVEVGARWKVFMGRYADARFAKYDQKYDPNKPLKFGDMNKPNLAGNWE